MVERRGRVDLRWWDGCCCGGLCLSLYLGGGEVRVFGVVEEMGGESGDVVVYLIMIDQVSAFLVCACAARKSVYSAARYEPASQPAGRCIQPRIATRQRNT